MRRLVCLLMLAAALACRNAEPHRVAVGVDTLVINGSAPVRLPINVLDARGTPVREPRYLIRASTDSAVRIADGVARCQTAGDAVLDIQAGVARANMLVMCRPIAGFSIPDDHELSVGGPPVPLPLSPVDSAGRPVTEWRAGAKIDDTTIARVRDGLLYPLSFGRTWLTVDFGGITEVLGVEVLEEMATDLISVAPGEYRTWPLPAGRFEVKVRAPAHHEWKTLPAVGADGGNCALYRTPPFTMHCVVQQAATVMVRMPDAMYGSRDETMIDVRIVRRPEFTTRPVALRVRRE